MLLISCFSTLPAGQPQSGAAAPVFGGAGDPRSERPSLRREHAGRTGCHRGGDARWALGGLVHGNSRRRLFLDRLDPPPCEVWEIRVVEHSPQARLCGRFAERDTLILTGFHTRGHLGKKTSRAWRDAMTACVASWERLFPDTPPLRADSIHDYVSENCHDFPI